jgi:D-xylose transport system substrate-binding protein
MDSTLGSQIKSVYTTPFWVTSDNMADTIIKDGWLSASDLCTSDLAQACTKAGIQ